MVAHIYIYIKSYKDTIIYIVIIVIYIVILSYV